MTPVDDSGPVFTPTPGVNATGKPLDPLVTATATREGTLQNDPSALRGTQITVWHAWVGAAADLFQSQITAFNRTNMWGITVIAVPQPDNAELFTQVISALATPKQPDVVAALPEQLAVWDSALVDLNVYATDAKVGLDIADLPAAFWPDGQTTRRVGAPAARSARFLFYNATWAQELGFDVPPATADDFETQACAANAAFKRDADQQNDGYGGWIVDPSWDSTYAWMLAFGGGYNADPSTGPGFASSENAQALTYLKTLYDNNCAWLVEPDAEPFEAFAARRALFVGGSLPEIQDTLAAMRLAGNADTWTALPYPGTEGRQAVVTYGTSYAVLQSDETRQLAAWLFIRWMLEKENQLKWVQMTQLLPLRISVLAAVNESRSTSPQWSAAAALIPLAQPTPSVERWRWARLVLGDASNGIFLHNVSVDILPDVLETMDATVEEISK